MARRTRGLRPARIPSGMPIDQCQEDRRRGQRDGLDAPVPQSEDPERQEAADHERGEAPSADERARGRPPTAMMPGQPSAWSTASRNTYGHVDHGPHGRQAHQDRVACSGWSSSHSRTSLKRWNVAASSSWGIVYWPANRTYRTATTPEQDKSASIRPRRRRHAELAWSRLPPHALSGAPAIVSRIWARSTTPRTAPVRRRRGWASRCPRRRAGSRESPWSPGTRGHPSDRPAWRRASPIGA